MNTARSFLEKSFQKHGSPSKLEDLLEFMGKVYCDVDDNKESRQRRINYIAWDITYDKHISNSHSCPIGGACNWAQRDPLLPTGYPGFYGRVWFGLDSSTCNGPERRNSVYMRLHTGTGGYGHYSNPFLNRCGLESGSASVNHYSGPILIPNNYPLGFDCKVFVDDFPDIKSRIEKMIIKCQLENKMFSLKEKKIWIRPDLL